MGGDDYAERYSIGASHPGRTGMGNRVRCRPRASTHTEAAERMKEECVLILRIISREGSRVRAVCFVHTTKHTHTHTPYKLFIDGMNQWRRKRTKKKKRDTHIYEEKEHTSYELKKDIVYYTND